MHKQLERVDWHYQMISLQHAKNISETIRKFDNYRNNKLLFLDHSKQHTHFPRKTTEWIKSLVKEQNFNTKYQMHFTQAVMMMMIK